VADTVQLCSTVVWWGRFVHGHREEGRRALALERGSAYSGDGDRGDVRERSVLVREAMVHPYYSPVGASARAGVVSMAAYLVFWAVVVVAARRELQRRFPRGAALGAPARDAAVTVLRDRYARGEVDRAQFLQMVEDLRRMPPWDAPVTARRDDGR
jgi:putative membrane protein